jgi:hypothetical protein
LKGFNTEKKILIKNSRSELTEEDKILNTLFVTNAAEAIEEFEKEKEEEVEHELGNKVAKPDIK